MRRVEKNKVVYLNYRILDGKGQLFEQSAAPTGYVHGVGGELFEQLEQALEGRVVGDTVTVVLPMAEGFGPPRPELVFTHAMDGVPEDLCQVGAEIEFENEQGERLLFRVTGIADGKLTLDANHPLTGQDVTFIVEVVDIRDATPEEIANRSPAL